MGPLRPRRVRQVGTGSAAAVVSRFLRHRSFCAFAVATLFVSAKGPRPLDPPRGRSPECVVSSVLSVKFFSFIFLDVSAARRKQLPDRGGCARARRLCRIFRRIPQLGSFHVFIRNRSPCESVSPLFVSHSIINYPICKEGEAQRLFLGFCWRCINTFKLNFVFFVLV
jgi:hypothetical protein